MFIMCLKVNNNRFIKKKIYKILDHVYKCYEYGNKE